jgi:hypothetical protein
MYKTTGPRSPSVNRKSLASIQDNAYATKVLPLLVLLALSATTAWGMQAGGDDESKAENAKSVTVSGSVISARLAGQDEHAVKVRLSVSVVVQNAGQEGIILLKDTPGSNGEYLFSSPTAQEPLWTLTHPPTFERTSASEWQKLQSGLDQKEPPDSLTITLGPGETISWNMIVVLSIPKSAASGATWDAIRKASPCWIKLDIAFWPMNVEQKPDPDNPALAKKLFKRWRKKGKLIFAEKQSEPIQVKLDGIGG